MLEFKPILAIETSDELCSAAVLLSPDNFAEINFKKKFVHSEKLMPMISDLLKNADTNIDKIGAIAVSMGPGSFTGLRIGLTIAKGLAVSKNIPIIPVPTFDALALQISAMLPRGTKFNIVNNANINEVYSAKYQSVSDGYEVIAGANLLSKDKVRSLLDENIQQYGNFPSNKKKFTNASPNASSVAKWAYIFGEDLVTFDHDFLEPNYLKDFVVRKK